MREHRTETRQRPELEVRVYSRDEPMSAALQFEPGTSISKKIRIEKLIGRGGMAEVYAAHHVLLDEAVAVKVLRRELIGDRDTVARFLREARASARVRSEHAVVVYDVDELENGQPFMVMERLDGEDLAQRLERLGRLPVIEGIGLVLQACRAVRVAHQEGIVHRDIKPGNLFLSKGRTGEAILKVLDFGISKAVSKPQGDAPTSSITQIGSLLGSPRYMAPEQMVDARNVDARSDVWALACTAYRAIVGAPPFDGGTIPEICTAVLTSPAVRADRALPGIPPGLGEVLERGMAKQREDRFPSIDAFMAALEPFATPTPIVAISRPPAVASATPTARTAAPLASLLPTPTLPTSTQPSSSLPTVPIPRHAATPDPTEAPTRVTSQPMIAEAFSEQRGPLAATYVSASASASALRGAPGPFPVDASQGAAAARVDATVAGSSLDGSRGTMSPSRTPWLGAVAVGVVVAVCGAGWLLLRDRVPTSTAVATSTPAKSQAAVAPPPPVAPETASAPVVPSVEPAPSASVSSAPSASAVTSVKTPSGPLPRRPLHGAPPSAPPTSVPDPFGGAQK